VTGQLAFRAVLCGVDGARAGCGPCVRAAGHPVGGEQREYHRDAHGDRFVLVEQCPFCEHLAEEGADLARHVAEAHGGTR
jgi:hypothetical protein